MTEPSFKTIVLRCQCHMALNSQKKKVSESISMGISKIILFTWLSNRITSKVVVHNYELCASVYVRIDRMR